MEFDSRLKKYDEEAEENIFIYSNNFKNLISKSILSANNSQKYEIKLEFFSNSQIGTINKGDPSRITRLKTHLSPKGFNFNDEFIGLIKRGKFDFRIINQDLQ